MTTLFVYQFIVGAAVAAALGAVHRYRSLASCLAAAVLVVIASAVVAFQLGSFFASTRLLAYGYFVHVPVMLAGFAVLTLRDSRLLAAGCALAAGLVVGVGAYSFWIEPTWLQITRVELSSAKITRPVRIAVIADLQTDVIGKHEHQSLARVMQLSPDVILLAGDYLQTRDRQEWESLCRQLRDYLRQIDFSAPLGVYVVGGNTDLYRWPEIFDGLPARVFRRTDAVELEELKITGLSVGDSFNTDKSVEGTDKFHVVVGHSPNFALGDVRADLLVAGHTHGGQVRLPFFGPLVTFSRVPRSWATGVTELDSGAHLVVSRGVGMERGNAPRLRFLCRPEVMLIEVTPQLQVGYQPSASASGVD